MVSLSTIRNGLPMSVENHVSGAIQNESVVRTVANGISKGPCRLDTSRMLTCPAWIRSAAMGTNTTGAVLPLVILVPLVQVLAATVSSTAAAPLDAHRAMGHGDTAPSGRRAYACACACTCACPVLDRCREPSRAHTWCKGHAGGGREWRVLARTLLP